MEVEIFVVDNHSQDDSLDYLIPRFPEVRFIANTENVGFARANNQAIEQSTGKYVLLLNPDTVIAENTLYEVFQFMEAHPEAGGTGVKMLDGDGRFLPESKRGFPTPWVSFCKIFGLSALFPHSRIFGRYHMKYLSPDECHPIDILSGAFMFMRRETLDKSGLLDESFFMYGEDIDLSYRLVLDLHNPPVTVQCGSAGIFGRRDHIAVAAHLQLIAKGVVVKLGVGAAGIAVHNTGKRTASPGGIFQRAVACHTGFGHLIADDKGIVTGQRLHNQPVIRRHVGVSPIQPEA